MKSFAGKRCVVTGAGSGIGRALAIDLAARGGWLAVSDVNEEGLAETLALIDQATKRHSLEILDVTDAGAIEDYAASLSRDWGTADWLFNVAGLTRFGPFSQTPAEAFDQVMDVNFQGVVRMTRAFLPQLLQTRGGVVNISSLFGLIGFPGQSHYCASKFAVRGFSETLAMELKPLNVSVSCVHPGGVATRIAQDAVIDAQENRERIAETKNTFADNAFTSPERAARLILNGAAKGKRRIVIGRDAFALSMFQRLFPAGYQRAISGAVIKRLQE
ncbi:MAG: SDR family oxidoreductase [Pseudomonadota bacterium]